MERTGQRSCTKCHAIASLTPSQYNGKDDEVPTLGDWWEVVRQHGDSSNSPVTDRVDVGDECFYTGPELNMTAIENLGGNLNCTRVFEVNENRIYHILFSHTAMFTDEQKQRELLDSCSGKFRLEIVAGMMVNMMTWAREPQPQNDDEHCSISFHRSNYGGPPNGDEKVDSLVANMQAKIAEEVTNKDGKGWSSNDGNELTVSSCCCSPFLKANAGPPPYVDEESKLSFNAVV